MSSHDGDEVRLQAWRALLLAHNAAVRAIENDVQREGRIPLTWYDVLLELDGAGLRGLRMQELAQRVVLSRTRVSRLVDEMVRAGLVAKKPDATDKRVVWAVVTDDGRKALRDTAPAYLRGIHRHFGSHLTEDECAVLAEALLKVAHGGERLDWR
ncbi:MULTISPECIES: MarR family winged helix-turn-helix transcriptional regulator [Streptomycetaceae]|uniref:MarR family transcriptional regulator n=1 Tax=Streptantibioticus cattleyicolor (strain ATCC 35852 / DSM 46488 / JCM 4925 / NBRC 14057 / NRRL 8057) TaxID=1003195 RepID=F8JVZ8_STREN|nr:MarR family transcriptional regulator [Streptantibioticus cattleyicolor]AEW92772.1 MarR family transcriptional regulator [Streptantibioticus cattleyicolor NRRL 8057 = DSM 46488]MYS57536.1 MarR family transcriptional regulator [Streptomyces sp. SID5468]CCB73128.1 Transcriptional regulator [Streptantibioticus cattleyicolor NRRL 8057 = DSM 46488]